MEGKSAPMQVSVARFPLIPPSVSVYLVQTRGMVDKFRKRTKGGDGGNGNGLACLTARDRPPFYADLACTCNINIRTTTIYII